MVERICSRCEGGNPSENLYCGHCGAAFDQPLAQRPSHPLARRSWQVPTEWKQASKVVALGAATIAAEAGLAWLQRRQKPIVRAAQPSTAAPTAARIIAMGWRITETWQSGQLQERVQEQVMWLEPEPRKY
jgi:hypothetical protein